jgi:23S rRNA (adenine2503-C2)-methyltransferase
MTPAEIAGACSFRESFRGRQVYRWLARGASSFEAMSDLAKVERQRLEALIPRIYSTEVSAELPDEDGSRKLQLRLRDGAAIECVVLEDIEGRRTACLSCQVGCAMDCGFCKTGSLGFLRDLGPDEIIEQYHHLVASGGFKGGASGAALGGAGGKALGGASGDASGGEISNVVFMGMGEPLNNLEAVRKAIDLLVDPEGIGMSRRKITISTSGIVPGILDLAANGPAVRLAVSLTSAIDEVRSELMPVNRRWPLAELKAALLEYQDKTGERITIEAALMGGKNSGADAARALVAWTRGLHVQVNVIPWNAVPGLPFVEPTRVELAAYLSVLEASGIEASRRMRRGRGVMGACGQLGDTLKPGA